MQTRAFATAREWGQFHTPKNLAMALSGEAGELLEVFQWLDPDESFLLEAPEKRRAAEEEMGDVLIYLVRLADQLGINLLEAAHRKLEQNETKYPVELARGNAKKYTEFDE